MALYILRRIGMMLPTLVVISVVSFFIIQLPPGDFLSSYVAQLAMDGDYVDQDVIDALERRYGLGQPITVQYYKWVSGIFLRGDWGQSMEWEKPVKDLIWERIGLTMVLSTTTMLFSWFVSIPIGIYSATHQYGWLDYLLSFVSFVGRGTPGFLLALIVMYFAMRVLDQNVGGLFSDEYILEPWSWDKFVDMARHIWIPILILAFGSTAGLIRITRANTLDELHKPYVTTARAKGVKEARLILKYPVRVALNPFFSTVGWSLASLISGSTLVATVLSLQTTGPMMLRALTAQDMYLAGSFLLLLSTLTVIGTLLSDILLAWVDPRIRLSG
jgi:peptide/nickel transport system permease protein